MTISPRTGAILAVALFLQACDSSSSSDPMPLEPLPPTPVVAGFTVTVTNLTNAQPLSPVAVIAHDASYAVFELGQPASLGLEELAEGGSNAALLAEAAANGGVVVATSGAAPIGPAGSETIQIFVPEDDVSGLLLSTSTMLVNTNDAVSGINGVALDALAVGDVIMRRSIVYDTGTEANTELAAEIPGPAGGGEGFNAARDDRLDLVAMHPGIVGADDGFSASSLNNQHRFDNPAVGFRIERNR